MIRKTLFYLIFISAIAFFYVTCSDVSNAQTYEGKVIKVTDGDSINILHEGDSLRIRLAEIDTPERKQPFWRKYKDALADYIAGKEVTVDEYDVDLYGRVVGHVYQGNFWVNAAMVRSVNVYVYPRYAMSIRIYELEQDARENKIGIWKLPKNERIMPWEWRKKQNE